MSELLSELKDACQAMSAAPDDEMLARGGSTWFRGLPAHAEKGTVALGLGRDTRVVFRERDIRNVTKDGEHYNVEVSSEANVLLRIEKSLKATVPPDCGCSGAEPGAGQMHSRRRPVIELGPVTVCKLICTEVVVDDGKQCIRYEICLPVDCIYPEASR